MPRRAPLTEAQRAEAVQAVVVGGHTLRAVAKDFGTSHVQVRRWVLAHRIAHPEPKPAKPSSAPTKPVASEPSSATTTGIVVRLESIRGQAIALRAELDALVSMLR